MEVIILAGGFGTRLKHVVSDVPKPMAPINDKPFLEYIFEDLNKKGVTHVVLAVGYMKEKIEEYFKNQYKNIEISYSEENSPLGTGGAIKKAVSKCREEDIFIINGDTFYDVDLEKMKKFHIENKSSLTIAVKEMENFDRYGSLVIENNKIIKFEEKKAMSKGKINGGIYLIKKNIFQGIEEESFSFEKEILENEKTEKYAYESNGYFIDIGIPEDYYKFIEKNKSPKISVIIPSYNRAHILEKTIPTYLQNGVIEIIVVDDCSTDNTKEIIKKLIHKYPQIKYYRMFINSRQQAAKNKGIELSSLESEYIYFGDDDSILVENSINYLYETIKEYNADLVGAKALYLSNENELKDISNFIDKFKKNIQDKQNKIVDFNNMYFNFQTEVSKPIKVSITPACFLIKKSIIGNTRFSSEYKKNSYREETDFVLEITKKGKKVMYDSRAIQINFPRSLSLGGAYHKKGVIGKLRWFYWAIKNNNLFLDKHYEYLVKKEKVKHSKIYLKYLFIFKEGMNIFRAGIKKIVRK